MFNALYYMYTCMHGISKQIPRCLYLFLVVSWAAPSALTPHWPRPLTSSHQRSSSRTMTSYLDWCQQMYLKVYCNANIVFGYFHTVVKLIELEPYCRVHIHCILQLLRVRFLWFTKDLLCPRNNELKIVINQSLPWYTIWRHSSLMQTLFLGFMLLHLYNIAYKYHSYTGMVHLLQPFPSWWEQATVI